MIKSHCLTGQFKIKYGRINSLVNDKNFGRRLRAETKDFIITLPERFINNLTDEILADLNKERYVMTYKGKDETKHNMVLLDFEKISK